MDEHGRDDGKEKTLLSSSVGVRRDRRQDWFSLYRLLAADDSSDSCANSYTLDSMVVRPRKASSMSACFCRATGLPFELYRFVPLFDLSRSYIVMLLVWHWKSCSSVHTHCIAYPDNGIISSTTVLP